MRILCLAVMGLMSLPLAAQDQDLQEKKPAAKKSAAKKKAGPVTQKAHKKPTPEQIRKFKELEKKKKQQ